MAKPGVLCKLKKGMLIDSQDGFVDTFNWMVDFINNLKAEEPLELDKKLSDRPVLKVGFKTGPVVTDIRYDRATHQLIVEKMKGKLDLDEATRTDETVFTAVPHSGES